MSAVDERPASGGGPGQLGQMSEAPSVRVKSAIARATLPPPEWTMPPVRERRRGASAPPTLLDRRTGERADEATLRARLEEAWSSGDTGAERAASIELARLLASKDRDLDEAAQLAMRAVRIADDADLRRDLAGWLESLGEAGLAAAMLRAIVDDMPPETLAGGRVVAPVLVRAGVLHARAGDPAGASEAFEDAARLDGAAWIALELRGTLAAWAPEVVTPASGAASYVEAAARRERAGDDPMEDLLRAFELDPASEAAADALAAALEARGKSAAADAIRREHDLAAGAGPNGAAARRAAATAAGDVARALAAAFDEGLDGEAGTDGARAFDELLLRAGLHELLAARLERYAADARASGKDREAARLFDAIARIYAGPAARPGRAAAAYLQLVALDPSSSEARAALKSAAYETGSRGDVGALVDALDRGDMDALRWHARDVFELPEGPPADPSSPDALERAADAASPAVAAVLLAVASERVASSDRDRARRLAERACQIDHGSVRAVVAMAAACRGDRDRVAASAFERAIKMVSPRGAWCDALADALEDLGEHDQAVAWTQQRVALRPGDRAATQSLIQRVARVRDASRLGDMVAWALSQPQPAAPLAELVAEGVTRLADLDADRVAVVARRALDAFGPHKQQLRDALLLAAERAGDEELACAVIERWIAAGATADERRQSFVDLARRRAAIGDRDGEARAVVRALRLGAPPESLAERVRALTHKPMSADGTLAWLEARATVEENSSSWRELGAALWDLAGDRRGAVRAWIRGARVAPERGYWVVAHDMTRFGDPEFAYASLDALVDSEQDPSLSAAIAQEAARAALGVGRAWRAFELACLALERDPEQADALEIAEDGAVAAGRPEVMTGVYDAMASRSLGRFGRRAAHYRGARFFEQHASPRLALMHAGEAFVAVPTEGATLMLLARIAAWAKDRGFAVRTLERVAELATNAQGRAAWLLRASRLAGDDDEGRRLRVDCLLRAALLSPQVATFALLTDAARDLVRASPVEADALGVRLGNASRMLTAKIEGPDGARVALALAELIVDLFGDGERALGAVERAFAADADVEEYVRLVPFASALASAPAAERFLEAAVALIEKPYSNAGVGALKLVAAIAHSRGNATLRDRLTVLAAEREPEDARLLVAADEAVRRLGDEELLKRLDKKAPPDERAQALRAHARACADAGDHEGGIAAFERALELAPEGDRAEIDAEVRELYARVGNRESIEERALRAAESEENLPGPRADRFADVAQLREERGDFAGALDALQQAAQLDPEPLARWSALERGAELAKRGDLKLVALREIEVRVDEDARPAVLRRLARALEEIGDDTAALDTYHRVLSRVPDDEESDRAIEAIVTSTGDYAALADHLADRTARLARMSERRDGLRAVRLRRAAILEQRLGRAEEAIVELEEVLREWPDNESALRYLADLYERIGQTHRAAPLWKHLSALATGTETQFALELRAAYALREAGELASALTLARELAEREPLHVEVMNLRVELARALGDDQELGHALAACALYGAPDADTTADLWVEAAQAAARTGDTKAALDRAQRAAQLAPVRPATQLFARGLEYRQRGAGTRDDAQKTIEDLGRIEGELDPEDASLRAFLIAEAHAVLGEEEEARAVLRESAERTGLHALVALGLAERNHAAGDYVAALARFEKALEGNLLGFRSRGQVALVAADAAIRCERPADALRLFEEATFDDDTRVEALRRIAQLAGAAGNVVRARAVLVELARSLRGEERATALAQLGRLLWSTNDGRERADAERAFDEAIAVAPEGSVLHAQLVAEVELLRRRTSVRPPQFSPGDRPMSEPPPTVVDAAPPVEAPPSAPPVAPAVVRVSRPPPPLPVRASAPPSSDLATLEAALGEASSPEERTKVRRALARLHVDRGQPDAAESVLREALAEGAPGALDAGDDLAAILARGGGRTSDLLRVRRVQADLAPGDPRRVDALRVAALDDHNLPYARAIEHVARAFDRGAGPLPPPPLFAQSEQPGILALLARVPDQQALEALACLWESANSVFSRDPHALQGQRVEPDGTTPIARVYEVAVRLLDAPKIPLYVRQTSGALTASVALLSPPAATISGEVRGETPELDFVLGAALASALPTNVLALGLAEALGKMTWRAVLGAFGAPEYGRQLDARSGRLAERFWQAVPAKSQRRLQEILRSSPRTTYEGVVAAARQSARRVGMFVAGDFATAVGDAVKDQLVSAQALVDQDGLDGLCARVPDVADLFRLAVSPEYADARWNQPPASMKGTPSTGRFRFSRPIG